MLCRRVVGVFSSWLQGQASGAPDAPNHVVVNQFAESGKLKQLSS